MPSNVKYGELLPESSKKFPNLLIGVALAVCCAGAWFYSQLWFQTIKVDPQLSEKGTDIFLSYLFVVVALERAASVYLNIYRNPGKDKIQRRIERVKDVLEDTKVKEETSLNRLQESYRKEHRIISSLPDNTTYKPLELPVDGDRYTTASWDEIRTYLKMTLEAYNFKLSEYESATKKRASRIVFLGGVVVAFLGLSILDDMLIISTEILGPGQVAVFRAIDILITGGLIGGGSQSFAKFLNASNSVLEQVQKKKS